MTDSSSITECCNDKQLFTRSLFWYNFCVRTPVNVDIQRNGSNRSIDIEDRQMFPIFFTLFPPSMEYRYFRKKKFPETDRLPRSHMITSRSTYERLIEPIVFFQRVLLFHKTVAPLSRMFAPRIFQI